MAHRFESYTIRQNVPGVSGYCDPQDEKYNDMYGWYTLNRKCASNAITVPVGKRVEGVCDGYDSVVS